MRNLLPLLLVPALAAAGGTTSAPFAARLDGAASPTGNTVYSPTSITTALAMARAGASGETAAQMDRVLGTDAATIAAKLIASAKADPKDDRAPKLEIANRMYADKTLTYERAFLEATKKQFGAQAETVDFQNHANDARLEINKWVAEHTHDKIKDLLADGTVTRDTKSILVNAIYLKAKWASELKAEDTHADPFAVVDGTSKQVPTMHGEQFAGVGAHDGARVLDMAYYSGTGPKLSMLFVVPESRTLPLVEADYQKEGIAGFLAAAAKTERVDVSVPKFETGASMELSSALVKMGMTDAFGERASFSAMAKRQISISAVIHKAWIKVDEAGTEAAAATAITIRDASVMVPPQLPKFAVDRSFLFFVHDDQGNVLFAGRITDPSVK